MQDHSSQGHPEAKLLDNTEHARGPLQASEPSYNALDEAIAVAKAIQDLVSFRELILHAGSKRVVASGY